MATRHLERLQQFITQLEPDIYPENPSVLHHNLTAQVYEKSKDIFEFSQIKTVLDVGCGQGVALKHFKTDGLDAIGITKGEADYNACKKQAFNVKKMDMSFLDFSDNEFDLIWCRHCLEHSIMPMFTLAEFHRVLRPGGYLYVEVPAPNTVAHHELNQNHYSLFDDPVWLALFLRSGYQVLEKNRIHIPLKMGPDLYWAYFLQA